MGSRGVCHPAPATATKDEQQIDELVAGALDAASAEIIPAMVMTGSGPKELLLETISLTDDVADDQGEEKAHSDGSKCPLCGSDGV